MLRDNPRHPLFLRNYAQFLAEGDEFDRADEMFQLAARACRADGGAGEGEVLVQWAKAVWEGPRDAARAMSLFERAVEVAPDDCYVLAAYACFLWAVESAKDSDGQEDGVGDDCKEGRRLVAGEEEGCPLQRSLGRVCLHNPSSSSSRRCRSND